MNNVNNTIIEILKTVTKTPDRKTIFLALGFSLLLSVVIYITYRIATGKEGFQPYFAVTLVSLTVLSSVLMCMIQSNLSLSLGMLGSLSIVRFRTYIKDPRDIGFIFWSMAGGLAAATNSYMIGAVGSLLMVCIMILTRNREVGIHEMMLVVRGSRSEIAKLQEIISHTCIKNSVKAKSVLTDSYELVYDVKLEMENSDPMIELLMKAGGVDSVNLLTKNEKTA